MMDLHEESIARNFGKFIERNEIENSKGNYNIKIRYIIQRTLANLDDYTEYTEKIMDDRCPLSNEIAEFRKVLDAYRKRAIAVLKNAHHFPVSEETYLVEAEFEEDMNERIRGLRRVVANISNYE